MYINKAIKNSTKQGRSKHPEVLLYEHYVFIVKLNLRAQLKCLSLNLKIFLKQALMDLPGEGNGTQLQYFCLENPMDGGAWSAAAHGVTQSQT